MGVATEFRDGLGNNVRVRPETLVRVCAAMGAELAAPAGAQAALRALLEGRRSVPDVLVAWDGRLDLSEIAEAGRDDMSLTLEDGSEVSRAHLPSPSGAPSLPFGVHELTLDLSTGHARSTVISAPVHAWRPPQATDTRWGLAVHLAALRSDGSGALGDLGDLRSLARAVAPMGAEALTVLPILPTFNDAPAEPSPYSPVSRLFWSELALDTDRPPSRTDVPDTLEVGLADLEVRAALADVVPPTTRDAELRRYASFRGAQRHLGRDWTTWPSTARAGQLSPDHIDATEERFHLVAQIEARRQMADLVGEFDGLGVSLGLDLAVGVHPLGYDVWSRQGLFADAMAVGAPPDAGFPSGQNWGFPPVLPSASAAEGHAYLRASIAHQASVAGLLRVDHIMAMRRLYWIPQGMELHEGTYVSYPLEELFALLCLESHRHQCEIVGENLGTVPPEIDDALNRHRIRGMHLAQFASGERAPVADVDTDDVASIGTHDTPTFAGWLAGTDIDERVSLGLLPVADAPAAHRDRAEAAQHLATELGGNPDDPAELLELVIVALGASKSPMVLLWLEDLWLEPDPVNIPGTSSAERPNWQRPMRRPYDEVVRDPDVTRLLAALDSARRG